MDNLRSRHFIDLIKQKAIAKWGEDYWFNKLVHAYVQAENLATGQDLTPLQRRPQLTRLLKEDASRVTLDTAMLLLRSVDGDINIVFNNPEVVKLR